MNLRSWKVVLITGATTGVGRACATYLAQKDYTVYATCSSIVKEENLPYTLLEMRGTHPQSVEEVVNYILSVEGKIDVLINVPDACIVGPIEETALSEAYWQFEQHFFSVLRVCKAVLPHMRAARQGLILNMSTVAGRMGLPYQGLYSAASFALEGLSESLRLEVKAYKVKVVLMEAAGIVPDFKAGRIAERFLQTRSGYLRQFKQTLNIVNRDAQADLPPQQIARNVYRVLETKHPKLRYTSLSPMQNMWLILKRIIPDSWLERVVSSHYQLGLLEQKPKAVHAYKN